ncbi:MAG TPA: hypothetical protein VMI11_14125 [Actinomycetes bacterium]|nr:hypothetical protein [Actinomycetes bacterium]
MEWVLAALAGATFALTVILYRDLVSARYEAQSSRREAEAYQRYARQTRDELFEATHWFNEEVQRERRRAEFWFREARRC